MPKTLILALLMCQLLFAPISQARPHAGISGLAASADSAGTAGTNPADITRFESSAYRVNDKLSVAGSLAITYSLFDQERAVANIFDPEVGDGIATRFYLVSGRCSGVAVDPGQAGICLLKLFGAR